MSESNGKPQSPDENWVTREYLENRQKFAPERLLPYAGKHIAWSWDGKQIVTSADSLAELFAKVEAMGVNTERVICDYVDPL